MSRPIIAALLCTLLAPVLPAMAGPLDSFTVDYEGGALRIGQNDGLYGANGTPYTADTTAQNANLMFAQRISGEARFWGRHTVILLYAPLDTTTRVTLANPLTFRDTTFPAGSVVDSRYLCDGLRASYLYRFYDGFGFSAEGGGSLQIRNAQVAFSAANGSLAAAERDIGLVPALKLRVRYDMPHGVYALWDADGITTLGISSVQGAMLDTALSLGIPLQPGWDVVLRARYVAGGSEVPKQNMANWAQFGELAAGFRVDLVKLLNKSAPGVMVDPGASGSEAPGSGQQAAIPYSESIRP